MFITARPQPGLRSLPELRRQIQDGGPCQELWEALLAKVHRELQEPPLAPVVSTTGQTELRNRTSDLAAATANRIMDAALAALVSADPRYVEAAWMQMAALFDPVQWPTWMDQAHIDVGLNVDLRHGQLVTALALAYDWLYAQLSSEQRQTLLAGLDERAWQPFAAGLAAREHWAHRPSNWLTLIAGSFGLAGMALGEDHPTGARLIAFARPLLETYLQVLGPAGEFNESVPYAGSIAHVVRYFVGWHYFQRGRQTSGGLQVLSDFYRWYQHMTFPPGRVAGFGDPAPDLPPVVVPAAAVAAALQDPVLQGFYLRYRNAMRDSHRQRALELLYFDADLPAAVPDGRLPLGRAYHHQGKLISSRSSWDPDSVISAVYAKAGRETFHSHADWGQVCIDGYGDRLIVDLGAPPSYPRSQEYYYNYQQWGHNVLVLGANDTGGVSWRARHRNGEISWSEFDDARGGAWQLDLSGVYDSNPAVYRTVVHALPRIVVVVDQAQLPHPQPISLRWHLATAAPPSPQGAFTMRTPRATLVGQVQRLDGSAIGRMRRQSYAPPYHRDRTGADYPQRHEPFLEFATTGERGRFLSLFGVFAAGTPAPAWRQTERGWTIATPEGPITVSITTDSLSIAGTGGAPIWQVPLVPFAPADTSPASTLP